MSYININQLTFGYEQSDELLFDHVTLQMDGSWKLGLIGRNGRGKTTLLQILLGKLDYSGTVSSDLEFTYFPYPVRNPERMTLEIMQEICPTAVDWELLREADLLAVDAECLYRPFASLSNGEQTKSLLAALFAGENRFLLLDEPTNHVDAEGRRKIADYLKSKKGFILVSHDRAILDECIDHVISINRANIDVQQGNYSTWRTNFLQMQEAELAENEKLKKDIRRLNDAARQSASWSDRVEGSKTGTTNAGSKLDKGFVGHKAAKMMKRSKNLESRMQNAAEEKAGLLKNVETSDSLKLEPMKYEKNLLIGGKDLAIFYDNSEVCNNLKMEVHNGDRIALVGRNGCGKSSLLKLICGEAITYTGELTIGSGLVISYVPQSTAFLKGTIRGYASDQGADLTLLMTMLRKLGFERSQFETPMENMSEGQKKKILIAASLSQRAHIYIWDEPLNYIDIISREQIEELILTYEPTMLFVEHDTVFREKIATQVLEF